MTKSTDFPLRQDLEPAGFEIVEAEDGAAALKAFALVAPDIVVLVRIDAADGRVFVCEAIRAPFPPGTIPVLMASGLDDVGSIDRAYQVGATDLITKPIICPLLPHRPRRILRAHQLAAAQRIAGLVDFRWIPKVSCRVLTGTVAEFRPGQPFGAKPAIGCNNSMINIRDGGIGKTAEQARLAVRPFD